MQTLRLLRTWLIGLIVLGPVLYATLARAAGGVPPPGDYAIDAASSIVGFNVKHFAISSVDGKFTAFSGRVRVGDSLATTHIDATIDTRSIDTGSGMRDKHLRSADFFDAERFPTMTFTSTQVWGTPDNFGIKGNLTMKGVTKEVVWSARILDTGAVVAETKLDRTAFGVTYSGPVGNEVRVHLEIRMVRAAAAVP
jgi:polyisoprenoid-binding protein YceI